MARTSDNYLFVSYKFIWVYAHRVIITYETLPLDELSTNLLHSHKNPTGQEVGFSGARKMAERP